MYLHLFTRYYLKRLDLEISSVSKDIDSFWELQSFYSAVHPLLPHALALFLASTLRAEFSRYVLTYLEKYTSAYRLAYS